MLGLPVLARLVSSVADHMIAFSRDPSKVNGWISQRFMLRLMRACCKPEKPFPVEPAPWIVQTDFNEVSDVLKAGLNQLRGLEAGR